MTSAQKKEKHADVSTSRTISPTKINKRIAKVESFFLYFSLQLFGVIWQTTQCPIYSYISKQLSQRNKLSRSLTFSSGFLFLWKKKTFRLLYCEPYRVQRRQYYIVDPASVLQVCYLLSRLALEDFLSLPPPPPTPSLVIFFLQYLLRWMREWKSLRERKREAYICIVEGCICGLHVRWHSSGPPRLMDACLQLPLTQSIHVISKQISGKKKRKRKNILNKFPFSE